jgi:hypothetical protein
MSGSVSFAMEVGRQGVEPFNLMASIWGVLSVGFVLFEAAAARMSLPTEDYAWRPRVALIVQLVGVTALGLWRRAMFPASWTTEFFQLLSVAIVSAGALAMATEADRAGPAGRRSWLLAPGALSGFRLSVLLLLLSTALWSAVSNGHPHPLGRMVVAASYPILYLCAALWLCRGINPRLLGSPDATRFVLGGLALFGSFVPWLMAKGFASGSPEEFPLAVLSPVGGYASFALAGGKGLWVLGALALLAALLTDRLLARRRRAA